MKTYLLMTCVVLALVVAGCDSGTLVDPGSSTAGVTVAGKAPMMVPIKADATFAADLTVVPPVIDCGYGQAFPARFNAEGIYSHLGSTTIVIEGDACWVNADFSVGVRGHVTLVAANGDELWGVWGLKSPGPPPGETLSNWDFYPYAGDYPLEFTGGTGRFEGAYGFAAGGGTYDRATLTGTYWFEGMVSSVGSLK